MTDILSQNDTIVKKVSGFYALLTLWAHDGWATLVIPLFHHAIFSNGFDKWADSEVAHQHLVMAGAI